MDFKIKGVVWYRDVNGKLHPVRLAAVTAWDTSVNPPVNIGRGKKTSTDLNGKFSFKVRTKTVNPQIQLRVEAHGAANIIAVVGPERGYFWYSASPVYTLANVKKGVLSIKLQTGIPVANSQTDNLSARIFSLYDCMVYGAMQGWKLEGDSWMKRDGVPVIFPHSGSVSHYNPSEVALYIERTDALLWDTILHEYGHFFAFQSPVTIVNSPGGDHPPNWGSNIGFQGRTREEGLRYAWSEGFATVFSVGSQKFPAFSGLLPSIPLTGDTLFHMSEDGVSFFDMESPDTWFAMDGYGSEASVAAALWDVLDPDKDSLPGTTAVDETAVGFKKLWILIKGFGGSVDVTKFYNTLMRTHTRGPAGMMSTSNLFVINKIAPQLVSPRNDAALPKTEPLKFEWASAGDPSPNHALDNFTHLLYRINNETLALELIKAIDNIKTVTHTYTEEEWEEVLKATEKDKPSTKYCWLVMGSNDSDNPRVPPEPLSGEPLFPGDVKRSGFISNTNYFQFVGNVIITPPSVTLAMNQKQQFSAKVEGIEDQRVVWSIEEGDEGGLISADGWYTAPDHAGKYTVVATSVADLNLFGKAQVTVLMDVDVDITWEVSCQDGRMPDTGPMTFTAIVTGGREPYSYEWNYLDEIKTVIAEGELARPWGLTLFAASTLISEPVTSSF